MTSIAVHVPPHSPIGFRILDIGTTMKRKVYVKDVREVPRYAIVRRGEGGGLYYETEQQERAKEQEEGRKPKQPEKPKTPYTPKEGDEVRYNGKPAKVVGVKEGRGGGVQISRGEGENIWVQPNELEQIKISKPEAPGLSKFVKGSQWNSSIGPVELKGDANAKYPWIHVKVLETGKTQAMFLDKLKDPYVAPPEPPKKDLTPKEREGFKAKITSAWEKMKKMWGRGKGRGSSYENYESLKEGREEMGTILKEMKESGMSNKDKIEIIVKNTLGSFKIVGVTDDGNQVFGEYKRGGTQAGRETIGALRVAGVKGVDSSYRSRNRMYFDIHQTDLETIEGLSRLSVEGQEQLDGEKFKAHRRIFNMFKKLPERIQKDSTEVMTSCGSDLKKYGIENVGVEHGAGGGLGLAYHGTNTISIATKQFESRYNAFTLEEIDGKLKEQIDLAKRSAGLANGDPQDIMRSREYMSELNRGNLRVQTPFVFSHEIGHLIHFKIIEEHPEMAEEFAKVGNGAIFTSYARKHPRARGYKGTHPYEPFAECYAFYKCNPEYMRAATPDVYNLFQKWGLKEGYH